jgi:hypothetical protein
MGYQQSSTRELYARGGFKQCLRKHGRAEREWKAWKLERKSDQQSDEQGSGGGQTCAGSVG